jgi:integrase/recombinase XerD
MDLEYVSVEDSQYAPEQNQLAVGKPLSFPWHPTSINSDASKNDRTALARAETARVLAALLAKGMGAQDHVKQYLLDLHRRNCRPNTIRASGNAILLFLSFLKKIGGPQLEAITREDFSAFIEHEQDRGLKPRSVSTRQRSLHAFFNFLIERDVIDPDVLKRKMRIKVPDSLPRAIDPEDIKELLSAIRHPRDRALILVLLRSGMRIGELLSLKLEDLHLKEKRIEIFEAQKNRVGRVVYISDDAISALIRWLRYRRPEEPYLFYGLRGRPLCYEAARAVFHKYIDKARLSHKGYTLHCLRHTFASELLNAGMRLECLQQLLGHSCIEMTRRYARLTDITRKEEYFRAMAVIEKGGINGHYRCAHQLP